MARRAGGIPPRIELSPRARVVAGWLTALVLVVAVAFIVGRLGDQAGEAAGGADSTPSGAASPLPITFGTVLRQDGEVDPASQTERFTAGDTFAYSIEAAPPAAGEVSVEVVRLRGGAAEPVQTPAAQEVPQGRLAVGFQVPTQQLLDAFGPGEFVMRIYTTSGAVIGEGRFVLLDATAPSPS